MLDVGGASATMFQSAFMEQVHSCDHPTETGAAIELCRTFLFPDTRGAFPAFQRPKAPRPPRPPRARARITVPPPPSVPPFSSCARARSMPKNPEETGFLAGSALAARHPLACHDHPIGVLWRQRLALANGAALARHAGRTEDEAALRPATAGAMPGIFAVRLRSRTRRPLVASLAAARRARSARPSDSPGAPAERLDAWIVGRARCLLMMRSRTSATLPRRWPQGRGVRSRAAAWRRQLAKTSRRRSARPVARRRRLRWPRR